MALNLGELVAFLDLDTSKFDDKASKMPSSFSAKAAGFGAAGLVIGGVVAAAMAKGLTDAINFDDSLAKISGELALSEAESARIGANAGKVYADNYGESVEQVQGAMGEVITQIKGMGEASDDTVNSMTAKVLNYASAFEVETSDAIATVQQLMSNGLAGSADEAMDLMTTAMQRVPKALRGDMSDAITEYGPFFASLGFSGAEAFDLLAQGAEKGMYGIDKAGDAIKEFGIRAVDGSKATRTAFEDAGLFGENGETWMKLEKDLLAGGDAAQDAFQTIVGGLQGIEDPAARAQASIALFGTPLEDIGTNDIPKFLATMQDLGGGFADSAGAADAMGEKMGSSVASQMAEMGRQVEVLFAGLMTGLLPVLKEVFGFLAANPAVIQAIAIGLGILAVAFMGVAAAMWAASLTPISLIIGAIIVGIGLLVAAIIWLVSNWDAVWKSISDIWEGFAAWFGAAMTEVGNFFRDVWTAISSFFIDLWNGIVAVVIGIIRAYVGVYIAIWQGVATFFTGLWNGIASFFSSVWRGIVSTVSGIVSNFIAGWKVIWNGLISFFTGLWSGISDYFSTVWGSIVSWLVGKIAGFISGWKGTWNGLISFFSGLWSNIGDAISDAWNGILKFFTGMPGKIKGFFSGIGQWLWSAGRDLINGLLNGIQSLAGTIGSFFLNLLPDWIRGPFKVALGIHSPSTEFEGYGRNTIQGYLKGLDALQPDLDKRMGELVDTNGLSASMKVTGSVAGPVAGSSSSLTVNYHAAENRSLSAEEDLYAAMGSPRVTVGVPA